VSYAVFDTSSVEGRRKPIARELGARAIRLNHFDSQPEQAGFEHDERESGQEEIYVSLRGTGVLRVDGVEIPFEPGRYVLVSPEATRQVVAGSEGLSYAVVGASVA
jgi:quercetin dioxygenase-like cupin family protein